MNVDLTKKPYNLKESDITWVKDTIKNMTIEEKIGQLFMNMGASRDESYLRSMVETYHIGGVRYNPGTSSQVYDQNRTLQTYSKIPLLIAANTESGGNGAVVDGTEVGQEVKVAATNNPKYAYELGRVSGVEASAVGCNWSFAPIVDINRNWRNPIISSRSFSSDPDQVLELSLAYMKGIMESGIAPAAKHFPGDGVDERDQHLSFSLNSYSPEMWDATFGKVYQGLFNAGLPSLMAGHISLPEYVSFFKPEATLEERILPATLNPYILTNLLRDKMGFNGLVVTDASHMVALTGAMRRKDMLPQAIKAGCDLFLFFNDPDEDFGFMMDGYLDGVITEDRLEEALLRILGTKATLGLHQKTIDEIMLPKEEAMARIGLPENKAIFKKVADAAITLVKNKESIFPLHPMNGKRILLVPVKGHEGGFGQLLGGGDNPTETLKNLLTKEGFDVSIYESVMDKIMAGPKEDIRENIMKAYSAKRPVSELVDKYDLIINVANVSPNTDQRLQWPASKGTPDIPFYIHDIKTIFVSVQCPFHLADVPQVRTYINTYDGKPQTMESLVDKFMGRSEFVGVSPVDAFCGFEDTRY